MKKIRRYLPVLILVLALLILFWPAGNNDTGTEPALPTTEPVSSSPDAGALPDGGELQLLNSRRRKLSFPKTEAIPAKRMSRSI